MVSAKNCGASASSGNGPAGAASRATRSEQLVTESIENGSPTSRRAIDRTEKQGDADLRHGESNA